MATTTFLELIIVSTLCTAVKAPSTYDPCAGQIDGTIIQFDCNSYERCQSGYPRTVPCPYGTVFERKTFSCIKPGTGDTDCGLPPNDCSGKPNKIYTDVNYGCQTFYHCENGAFVSPRQYCDRYTVFDVTKQYCDHLSAVYEPCGTKKSNTPTTTTATTTPDGDADCRGKVDGTVINYNCNTFKECLGGFAQKKNCSRGFVFERESLTCKRLGSADTDCGLPVYNCYGVTNTLKTDRRYGCQTYYRCINNVFVPPRLYCVSGMVFNVATQRCESDANAAQIC